MEELPGFQPWQGFTAMFVTFWAVSAYFDHFLMTTVFCIAFGVLSEILVKTVYGGETENTPTELDTNKKQLEDLVSLASEQEQDLASEEKEEEGEVIPVDEEPPIAVDYEVDEEEEMDDDGPPPPLPVRDYEDDQEENKTEDLLINLTEISDLENAEGEGGQIIDKEIERGDVNNSSSEQSLPCQLESPGLSVSHSDIFTNSSFFADCQSDAEGGQEKETTTDIVADFQNEGEAADINTDIDNTVEVTNIVTDIDNEVEVTDIVTDTGNEVEVIDTDIEVTDIVTDFDNEVGATETVVTVKENEEFPSCPIISETVIEVKTERNDDIDLLLTESQVTDDEIPQAQQSDLLTSELEEPAARSEVENIGLSGEIKTQKYFDQDFILDIDLTDPAVEAAATKIQSAFKGYKTRKNVGNNSE